MQPRRSWLLLAAVAASLVAAATAAAHAASPEQAGLAEDRMSMDSKHSIHHHGHGHSYGDHHAKHQEQDWYDRYERPAKHSKAPHHRPHGHSHTYKDLDKAYHKGSPAPEFSCDAFPCKQNSHSVALCIEKQYSEYERLPVAPDSRACSCMAPGHSYADDAAGCVDANACTSHPCKAGDAPATCQDLPAPADASPSGRVCTCPAGHTYRSEEHGCVDDKPQQNSTQQAPAQPQPPQADAGSQQPPAQQPQQRQPQEQEQQQQQQPNTPGSTTEDEYETVEVEEEVEVEDAVAAAPEQQPQAPAAAPPTKDAAAPVGSEDEYETIEVIEEVEEDDNAAPTQVAAPVVQIIDASNSSSSSSSSNSSGAPVGVAGVHLLSREAKESVADMRVAAARMQRVVKAATANMSSAAAAAARSPGTPSNARLANPNLRGVAAYDWLLPARSQVSVAALLKLLGYSSKAKAGATAKVAAAASGRTKLVAAAGTANKRATAQAKTAKLAVQAPGAADQSGSASAAAAKKRIQTAAKAIALNSKLAGTAKGALVQAAAASPAATSAKPGKSASRDAKKKKAATKPSALASLLAELQQDKVARSASSSKVQAAAASIKPAADGVSPQVVSVGSSKVVHVTRAPLLQQQGRPASMEQQEEEESRYQAERLHSLAREEPDAQRMMGADEPGSRTLDSPRATSRDGRMSRYQEQEADELLATSEEDAIPVPALEAAWEQDQEAAQQAALQATPSKTYRAIQHPYGEEPEPAQPHRAHRNEAHSSTQRRSTRPHPEDEEEELHRARAREERESYEAERLPREEEQHEDEELHRLMEEQAAEEEALRQQAEEEEQQEQREVPRRKHKAPGKAVMIVTNTARQKAGSVTMCDMAGGEPTRCAISMVPMFKINGKNQYPQPTGIAAQRDAATGQVTVWIVDGARSPALICGTKDLSLGDCQEVTYQGYTDSGFEARQIIVTKENVAFVLAWDRACVVQCLDAKTMSQCSCVLGYEHHGMFPVGITLADDSTLAIAHNIHNSGGVLTCAFDAKGVSDCVRHPDLPLNLDGGMAVADGALYMSYTNYSSADLAERAGIIVCERADDPRPSSCRFSTGKIAALGGVIGLAIHDGLLYAPQHVKAQEVTVCTELSSTDVAGCTTVHAFDEEKRLAFRSPTAVAILPAAPPAVQKKQTKAKKQKQKAQAASPIDGFL